MHLRLSSSAAWKPASEWPCTLSLPCCSDRLRPAEALLHASPEAPASGIIGVAYGPSVDPGVDVDEEELPSNRKPVSSSLYPRPRAGS